MRRFLFSVLCICLSGSAWAAIIHVPADQPTIQAGIESAQAGDIVLVACGTYLEHDLVMKSGVVLRGDAGESGCVTVDAGGLGRILSCNGVSTSTAIEDLRFTGGFLTGSGETRGGAILVTDSSPTIRRCVFEENDASGGGGGLYALRSGAVIEDCIFIGNTGVDGGGLYLNQASPIIRGCLFRDNACLAWGGAIFCENGSNPALIHCTLVRNHAYQGGGIWCVWECRLRLENCLIAFSAAGEGVYAYGNPGHDSVVTLSCCDVFGNAGANYGGTILDPTGLDGNISSDPMFCSAQEDKFGLAHLSPCLPGQNSCGVQIGALGEGCDMTESSVLDAEPPRPALIGNAPNPFGLSTQIGFRLPGPTKVTLRIYDLQGREVRLLTRQESFPAGASAVRWDGRDDAGRPLASGIYLCRLDIGSTKETLRISLLR